MTSNQFGVRRPQRRFGFAARAMQKTGVPMFLPACFKLFLLVVLLVACLGARSNAQQVPRDQWGGMLVSVSQYDGNWIIAGKQHKVTLNPRNLALAIETRSAKWSTVASSGHDMNIKTGNEDFLTGLSEARQKEIVPYDAGFKTGVKISLSDWPSRETKPDLKIFLTVCLEGRD